MSKPTQDQIAILKMIHAVRKATSWQLVQELGLLKHFPYTVQDMSAYLKLLEREKLLNKVQESPLTYELSVQGLVTIEALPEKAKSIFSSVPVDKCFFFYTGVGPDKFTKLSACSLSEFRERIKDIDVKSLEFHVPRGNVQKWVKEVLRDEELAEQVECVTSLGLAGELLRNRILNVIDSRINQLTSAAYE
jgi:hypothetical protein